jgi:hypothetical protein
VQLAETEEEQQRAIAIRVVVFVEEQVRIVQLRSSAPPPLTLAVSAGIFDGG